MPSRRHDDNATPRIVVVGTCASGKSTLVTALRSHGYDAHSAAQEHSAVARLWQRSSPDVLIALVASIDAVRARRGETWPEWLHTAQRERLQTAENEADLVIDTSGRSAEEVQQIAVAFLETRAAS
ncbi:MAG: hypothetical protein QM692_00240 [Thermomicrobiales bacterium]